MAGYLQTIRTMIIWDYNKRKGYSMNIEVTYVESTYALGTTDGLHYTVYPGA